MSTTESGAAGIGVSEDPSKTPGSGGVYTYTMTNKLPAAAAGSYTIALEARNSVNLLAGTTKQTAAVDSAIPVQHVLLGGQEPDGGPPCGGDHREMRRLSRGPDASSTAAAVATAQECVMCHNPTLADGTSKQSVNFATQIHSIHRGSDSGQSVRPRNYQLPGSGIPRRPARLHHLPRDRHLSGR